MTPAEFKKQLDQLAEVIHRAMAYYTAWKTLMFHDESTSSISLDDQQLVLNRYRGLFTPVGIAILDIALLELSKIFDKDQRTASLVNLLNVAKGDRVVLVPNVSQSELEAASRKLATCHGHVANLTRMRNQRLAHLDAKPEPVDPLLIKDYDELAESIEFGFNTLSRGYDSSVTSWKQSLQTVQQDTADVLTVLREDIERKLQEHDEEMVQIGLGQAHRAEKSVGGRLNSESLRDVIDTLGLTREQLQRVENEYSARAGPADGSPE